MNIGDIAHTSGMLARLEKYGPDVEVTRWPSSVGRGEEHAPHSTEQDEDPIPRSHLRSTFDEAGADEHHEP